MNKENLEKQYYVPMEVNTDEDKAFFYANGYTSKDIRWWKIGNIKKQVILYPVTEEVYRAYMQQEWRKQKQEVRKKEYFEEHGIQNVSFDYVYDEFGIDIPDMSTCQKAMEFQEILDELRELLGKLQGVDKTIMDMHLDGYSESAIGKEIGMSQKGVNKRKNKVITNLKLHFQK